MSEFAVRRAVASDVGAILRLERETEEASHWAEAEYAAVVGQQDGDERVKRCCFVAELEGRLAGFAVGKVVGVDGLAELESVAVGARLRRMGVGRALCVAVMDWCRSLSVGELQLEVRAGSSGAIALYRGLRFETVGLRRGYYRDPEEDALLMRLGLTKVE